MLVTMEIRRDWTPSTLAKMSASSGFKYRIRRMKPRDITRVAALEQRVFADPWPAMAYVQELYFNPIARYFVLETWMTSPKLRSLLRKQAFDIEIQGFAGVRAESGRGHISTLAIHPSWRGYGFGELLLITVLETAIEMGAKNVTLEVRVSNEIAQSLYRKYTFHRIGQLHRYYKDGEDAALMEVDTSASGYEEWLKTQRKLLERRIAALQ